MIPIIIIRYGELTTKNRNRIDFIKQLKKNISYNLQTFTTIKIIDFYDRMEITNLTNDLMTPIIDILKNIFGISSISPAFRVSRDINVLATQTLALVLKQNLVTNKTFKLFVKRSDKSFPLSSEEITKKLALVILKATPLKVDVISPDLKISVKINDKDAYLFVNKIKGAGGFPVGSSGKILLLLSGGIDSPVAAYKLMQRGLEVHYLHFATPPFTLPTALHKVEKLVEILAFYNAGKKNLYVCNFTNMQNEITHISKPNYRITIMRRMFIRIANKLAEELNIQVLATGEALAQVASQTLASIVAINSVTTLPILRSLICEDKLDIVESAKKIGTYETSILPFADCCSLFVPSNPITQPKVKVCELLEKELAKIVDWKNILVNTVQNIKKM